MLKCLRCEASISTAGATGGGVFSADVICPACGKLHHCDLIGESLVLTSALSWKQKAAGWLLLIATVIVAFLIRKVL